MTQKCTHNKTGFPAGAWVSCGAPAKWVVDADMTPAEREEFGGVMLSYSCDAHLDSFERNSPGSVFLPLDTENH
jgi:hypothetical protein